MITKAPYPLQAKYCEKTEKQKVYMYKKVMSLFCVVVFSILTASYVSPAHAKEEPSKTSSHLLKKLMINKKAFDNVSDLIIRTVSNLPECTKCPAARNAAANFEEATKKLEKINKDLKYLLSDTDGLEPNEKAAVLMMCTSMADNALATKMILENLIAGPLYNEQWVSAAAGTLIATFATADVGSDDLSERLCPRTTPEDECRAAGCSWCWDYEGTCDAVVDENGQSQNPCCGYFDNEFECGGVQGCTWTPKFSSGYCSNRCPVAP